VKLLEDIGEIDITLYRTLSPRARKVEPKIPSLSNIKLSSILREGRSVCATFYCVAAKNPKFSGCPTRYEEWSREDKSFTFFP